MFRRLEDKTQVFPLQAGGLLRNRLTHSHEVSVLARSVVTALNRADVAGLDHERTRHFQGLIEAISLAHDLGNPPFGHKGEQAISAWFAGNGRSLVPAGHVEDFLNFDGNAQTFRILTRVPSVSPTTRGMNLCASTLAALVKYPAPMARKRSYFVADAGIYAWAAEECGLEPGQRHPATSIMEACDDIAYLVADVEDCLTTGIFDLRDVLDGLGSVERGESLSRLSDRVLAKLAEFVDAGLDEASASRLVGPYFRSMAIANLVSPMDRAFSSAASDGDFNRSLLDRAGPAGGLWRSLKEFGKRQIYGHASVSASECKGIEAIGIALDVLSQGLEGVSPEASANLPMEVTLDFLAGPVGGWHLVDAISLMTDHQIVDFARDHRPSLRRAM